MDITITATYHEGDNKSRATQGYKQWTQQLTMDNVINNNRITALEFTAIEATA